MKLDAIIIDTLNPDHLDRLGLQYDMFDDEPEITDDSLEQYQELIYNRTEALENATNNQYFAGQDDGKNFMAVEEKYKEHLESLFPEFEIQQIDPEDYPWDYAPSE